MTTKLPRVGSKEFKRLPYKDQLYILNLFYFDKDKYFDFCGVSTPELEYVDESLDKIFKLPSAPTLVADLPISFSEGCWCAYLSYFNPRWWEECNSPLDELDLSHKRIFSIQLFNFPLLSLDYNSYKLSRWLLTQPKKTRELNDVFFYLVKMAAALQYHRENEEDDPVDVWNISVLRLNSYRNTQDLNGDWPVLEPNERLIELVEEDVLAPLFSKPRCNGKRYYVPLVPASLFTKSQFYIKGWDFLRKS